MASWEVAPPHTMPRSIETVEAETRVQMARHAAIEARGFDSIRARSIIHDRIDTLLDEHSLFVAVENLVAGP